MRFKNIFFNLVVIGLLSICHASQSVYAKNEETNKHQIILQKAGQGDATAQYNLGNIYSNGQGVPQDYAEAVKWYQLAAKQGDSRAQNNLGISYFSGKGVPQDFSEAVNWYRQSAQQGDATGQYNLGYMYYTGQGVPQDYVRAHLWFNLAAARGFEVAFFLRDALAALMTSQQLGNAQMMARDCQARKFAGCN